MTRQIVLDTETTGLEPKLGHRIIEIGCVELVNRQLTGRNFHYYLNPQRKIEAEAIKVHGITNDFLADKPLFPYIVAEFIDFIKDAELIIHNAAFDIGFLDHELRLMGNKWGCIADYCTVFDTLMTARQLYPGQRNNLDALCKRYNIDNSRRELHGALLDAEILATVYLAMTGGQVNLFDEAIIMESSNEVNIHTKIVQSSSKLPLITMQATSEERAAHLAYLELIKKNADGKCLWEEVMNNDQ